MVRVGFHLEDRTDDRILKIYLARLLGIDEDELLVELNEVRARGIGQLFASLPKAIQKFWHLRAAAVVVGVDNDGQNIVGEEDPRHPRHWLHAEPNERCRYCRTAQAVQRSLAVLARRHWAEARNWPVVISVPVEALEAWLLEDAQIAGRRPFRPAESLPKTELKRRLYARPYPTREDIDGIAVPIAEQADLDALRHSSRSFGLFARRVLECREAILAF